MAVSISDNVLPTDWADKVRAAITNLETKTRRVLEPDQALAIIDDVDTDRELPPDALNTLLAERFDRTKAHRRLALEGFRPDVRGHDDDRVAEIDLAT